MFQFINYYIYIETTTIIKVYGIHDLLLPVVGVSQLTDFPIKLTIC
jgi:hypothetical protein